MAKGRKRLWGEPTYGTGLRILIVNDQLQAVRSIFWNAINDAKISGCINSKDAIKLIRASMRSRKPFNAVFIDKNLGYSKAGVQKLISDIERISPKSHICIHSAETGPGKFANFPFIGIGMNFKTAARNF